jgi:hypothetical protein
MTVITAVEPECRQRPGGVSAHTDSWIAAIGNFRILNVCGRSLIAAVDIDACSTDR